jgi:hypothetical protein
MSSTLAGIPTSPNDHSRLIPAPDNYLSIFLFHLRREGYGAQPRGSSADPQRAEEALLAASFLAIRGRRLTRSRGKAVIDQRIDAPATPG